MSVKTELSGHKQNLDFAIFHLIRDRKMVNHDIGLSIEGANQKI